MNLNYVLKVQKDLNKLRFMHPIEIIECLSQLVIVPKKSSINKVKVYNTNGFRIETMYDYYKVMKSIFLVAKLFFHPFIGYANLTILLP